METRNKRDVIKNVLIIFLIIMLVLTFFSNTIMNRSLPEVATQYASYKQISDRVRTTATVMANQDYSLVSDDAREIVEVKVRRGDRVERGQVLFVLSANDSTAVSQAETELNNLLIQREQFMLDGNGSGSASYDKEIEKLNSDLAKIDAKLTALPEDIAGELEDEIENIELLIEEKNDELTVIKGKMNRYESTYDTLDEVLAGLEISRIDYAEAKAVYEASKEEHEKKKAEIKAIEVEIEALQEEIDDYTEIKLYYEELLSTLQNSTDNAAALKAALDEAEIQYNAIDREYGKFLAMTNAKKAWESAPDEEKAEKEAAYLDAKTAYEEFTGRTEGNYRLESEYLELLERRESEYQKADLAYREVAYIKGEASDYKSEITKSENALKKRNTKMETYKTQLEELNKSLAELEEKMSKAESDMDKAEKAVEEGESHNNYLELSRQADALEAEIKTYTKQKSLREEKITVTEKLAELEDQKASSEKNDVYNDRIRELQLKNLNESISRKEKELATLRKNLYDTEITSPVSGTISSVNFSAGEDIPAGGVVCNIALSEKGYTMEFAATNEQCQRIRVGDRAEIQNYYWGTVPEIVVSALKNDPSNPGRGKIVVLTVTGDVEVGQSLTFALGDRSKSYDKVVPNSAVREDSNGQFILVVDSKSTPLGNRYTARRVDVEVIASDATSSALSGELLGGEFVITTSSAPVSDGMQVRLSDTAK